MSASYKHFYLKDDQIEWLSKEAHKRGIRVSHLVRILIEQEREKDATSR